MIFINTAYFPLGCIRYYAPETHQWVTECRDDRLLFLRLLRNISGFFFDYIPHFTIGVNVVIILYLNYYRITRKVLMYNRKQTASELTEKLYQRGDSVSEFEYTMIFQPLMLACVLAIEPICFFLSNMANKVRALCLIWILYSAGLYTPVSRRPSADFSLRDDVSLYSH